MRILIFVRLGGQSQKYREVCSFGKTKYSKTRLARQRPGRRARGVRRRARAHPRGDRVLAHRRCRSDGRALCLVHHRDGHLDRRGASGDDFSRDRCDGARHRLACRRLWVAVFARGRDTRRNHSNRTRLLRHRPVDEIHPACRHGRLRQRLGDFNLPGAADEL